jgi:hypothetical protein
VGLHRHPGKLISLPALALVCWRRALVSAALLAHKSVRPRPRETAGTAFFADCRHRVVVALHWLTFYVRSSCPTPRRPAASMALRRSFLAVIEPMVKCAPPTRANRCSGWSCWRGALVVGGVPVSMHAGTR